ncbi:MAG: phosphodiester glycosidase family protein [Cyanobacteria bacterium P01_A01_bin.116]
MQLDKKTQSNKTAPKNQKPPLPKGLLYGLLLALGVGVAGWGLTQLKSDPVRASDATKNLTRTASQLLPGNLRREGAAADSVAQVVTTPPRYRTYELMQGTVHVVQLAAGTPVSVAVADDLTTVEAFAQRENAFAVLNAGFFDPNNGKTTSHLTVNGQPAGDPADNEGLTGNEDLQDYLTQIFNRSEFRAYQCNASEVLRYDITLHNAALPNNCQIVSAVGAGPRLMPRNTSTIEAFTDYEDGELIRDAIGSVLPNARSAIALKEDESILLMMVAQRYDAPGMTLVELAEFAESLGATELLNLDGGSSSSLYYDGQTHSGKLDDYGHPILRPVKSVIVVGQ